MWHLQTEASLQPEQRGKHAMGWKVGRKEAGRNSEGAQRALDLVLETLGSHGRSLSRGVTSRLASGAATLKGEGRKDRQTDNRRDQARAHGGGCPGSLALEGQRTCTREAGELSGLDGQLDAESESVPGFLLGQQEGL